MLKNATVEYLRGLTYDPSAERLSCFLPLAGIYWSDEIPDFKALGKLPKDVSDQVFRLMGVRMQVWNDGVLSVEDQELWNDALAQVPDCPLFQRLTISEEDRKEQLDVERETLGFFECLAGTADEFSVDQDGSFSATFDLTKDDRRPVWKRLLSWCRNKWS